MIFRTALAASILLSATPVAAEQIAGKIAITPQSNRAALIIKAAGLPVAPSVHSAYRLQLQVYDPVARQLQGGYLGGAVSIAANPKLFVNGYLVIDVKPGTYTFSSFSQQDWWALCFQDASLQFTIKSGEVLYLGELDARREARELQQKAVSAGRTQTRNSEPVHFFDNVTAPMFAPVDDDGLRAAAAMAKTAMPLTTVAPQAVAFAPARFGTGSTLFGQRICEGYFHAKAK